MRRHLALGLLFAAIALNQEKGLTARDLYLKRIAEPNTPPGTPEASPVTLHFGVRYNILLVNPETQAAREVDPDSNFLPGDCVAIRLAPNRSGRLFVFNQGAGGTWQALLPSPLAPQEPNFVRMDVPTLIPAAGCFLIDKTRGTETLLVVVTNKDPDQSKLIEATKAAIHQTDKPQLLGSGEIKAGGEAKTTLVGRELSYQKIKTPQSPSEPPHSVYVASISASDNDQIALAIKVRHE